MTIKNPVHPGSLVREDCIEALGLSVTAAAKQLGVTRQTLSNLTNEKIALTPEMSIRLEKLGWGSAGAWVRMQANYDLAQARLSEDKILVNGKSVVKVPAVKEVEVLKELTRKILKEKSSWILNRTVDSFTPILVSRKARKNYSREKSIDSHPLMSIGTGVYLSVLDKKWLVTANHIVTRSEKEFKSAPWYVRVNDEIVPLWESSQSIPFCRFENEDVAIVPLDGDVDRSYSSVRFLTLDSFFFSTYSSQFRIAAFGYLNKLHKAVSDTVEPSQFLTKVGRQKDREKFDRIFLQFNRRDFEGDVEDNNYIPQPDGLSGGPLFCMGTVDELAVRESWAVRFCGLLLTQTDKGQESHASFVPAKTVISCIESACEKLQGSS